LDDAASRLRTDILAVARKCAQQASCDLSLECLEAWRASVAGPP
jgi:hypothetical protein